MSMTKEEAIEYFKMKVSAREAIGNDIGTDYEAYKIALSALRPITREQVEQVWKGCPECKPRCGLCVHMGAWDKYGKPYVCEQCVDCSDFESEQKFCEVCGSPLTDEAVDMVMERLGEVLDADTGSV